MKLWPLSLGLGLGLLLGPGPLRAQPADVGLQPAAPPTSLMPAFSGTDITRFVPGALSTYLHNEVAGRHTAFFTPAGLAAQRLEPVLGIQTFRWVARNPLMVLRVDLFEHYRSSPLRLIEQPAYGGAPLYAIVNANTEPQGYLSLVELDGTTLVTLWHSNPHRLP